MLYDCSQEGSGVTVQFEDETEVEAVRSAFQEHALHLISLGNDSSVSDYQKGVIERWKGSRQRYRGVNHDLLAERLRFFVEATEERTGEILGEADNPDRIADSARRYELGHCAASLLESMGVQAGIEEGLGELLDS